jgi:hypothetical protein
LVCNLLCNYLIVNPTEKILLQLLTFLDSDEGIRIESKSTSKKMFINKNLLGNYVILLNYTYTKNMNNLLNSRINYAYDMNCKSDEIVYLNTLYEVLDLIHSEFEDIEVNGY